MREALESRGEHVNSLSFEEYREICDDKNPSFRKVGILESLSYDQAVRDPDTVSITVKDKKVPLLAPIKYAAGYDSERISGLVETPNTYLFALPPDVALHEVEQPIDLSEKGEEVAIVVESAHNKTSVLKAMLPTLFKHSTELQPQEFIDPRIKKNRNAAMSMYALDTISLDEEGNLKQPHETGLGPAFERLMQRQIEAHGKVDTYLLESSQLREQPELMDKLWELCEDRFEWLGDYHPVSMEETKDFFTQIVLNDNTYTAVRFDDEWEPVCFSFFMLGLDQCSWLQEDFVSETTKDAESKGESILFFHGIVSSSSPEKVGHYARDIMHTVSQVSAERGGKYRVMFESTNLSSIYIPHMVQRYIDSSDGVTRTGEVERIDSVDYWYLTNSHE